ncbi:hypothetical protein ABZ137_40540 [Streptomyces bobili]|uniref:hypothetical protein n=1 Tax=Streptomyces bobili TaxID=67280 RepID=UPI0033AE2D61
MSQWLDAAAVLVTAAGIVSAAAAYLMVRSVGSAVAVLLDFVLAAGLLRLAGDLSWGSVLMAAAVVAVRKVISVGLAIARHSVGVSVRDVLHEEVRK